MLPRTLRKSTPQSIFFAAIMTIPFIIVGLLSASSSYQWPSSNLLAQYINPICSIGWFASSISVLMVVLAAVYLQYVFYKYKLFPKANQFALVLFVGIISGVSNIFALSEWTVGLVFMIRLLDRAFEIQRVNKPNTTILEASFTAGFLTIISFDFIWIYPIVLIAYLYSGNLSVKGFFISAFGFILPYYFTRAINYLLDVEATGINPRKLEFVQMDLTAPQMVFIVGCAFVIIIGVRYFLQAITINKVIVKNHLVLVIIFSVLATISAVIGMSSYTDVMIGVASIFCVLAGLYFINASKIWLMEVSFVIWYGATLFFLIAS